MNGILSMRSLLVAGLASVVLSGCDLVTPDEVVGTTVKTYEITDVSAPRYTRKRKRSFRVSIRDVETGKDLGRHYVARRCSGWYRLREGSRWTFTETTFRRKNGTTYTEVDVTDLCKRLG